MLNAKTPEWLTIGKPISVQPTEQNPSSNHGFREISGGTQSTATKVTIPGRNLEIKVEYPITWWANGASLSPDGTKLLINSGGDTHMLEIAPDGSYRPVELRLPKVTYDAGLKGFISSWFWAGNETLAGSAEIDNERGEFIEKRIYIFYAKKGVLSRLDVSGLGLLTTEGLTVTKVADDLTGLKLSLGNADFVVKADLNTVPEPAEQRPDGKQCTVLMTVDQSKPMEALDAKPTTSTPNEQTSSSTPWSIVVVLIVVACGLLWLLLKRRS
jgi:hypothetical protein